MIDHSMIKDLALLCDTEYFRIYGRAGQNIARRAAGRNWSPDGYTHTNAMKISSGGIKR